MLRSISVCVYVCACVRVCARVCVCLCVSNVYVFVRDRDSLRQQTKSTSKTYDKITNCRYCGVGSLLYGIQLYNTVRKEWNNNKLAIAMNKLQACADIPVW